MVYIGHTQSIRHRGLTKIFYIFIVFLGILVTSPYVSSELIYILSVAVLSLTIAINYTHVFKFHIDKYFLIFFSIYYGWLLIQLIVSPDILTFQYFILTPLVFLSFFTLFAPLISENNLFLPRFLSYSGVFLFVIAILILFFQLNTSFYHSRFVGGSLFGVNNITLTSIFSNRNTFGIYMCFASLSSVYLMLEKENHAKKLLMLNLVGLLLSDGQAAYAGFLAAMLLLLFFRKKHIIKAFILISILLSAALIYFIYGFQIILEYLSGRNYLWYASIQRLIDSPITGIDYSNAALELEPYIPDDGDRYAGRYGAHSSYFGILLSNGLIGGLSYIFMLIYLFIWNYLASSELWDIYTLASMLSILVIMIFETMTFGGLSMDSILLATFISLLHQNTTKFK